MSQSLEEYYEQALIFLEETAPAFGRLQPAQAGGLLTKASSAADPHLERLIDGCALLAGRVDHKIASDFPVLIESLLQVMYPHWMLIVPSFAIARLNAAASPGALRGGVTIPAGTSMTGAPLHPHGVACQYRTGYSTTLWPIWLEFAQWQSPLPHDLHAPPRTVAALRLRFRGSQGVSITSLPLEKLRLFLEGDEQLITLLYEMIFLQCLGVELRVLRENAPIGSILLKPSECLAQVGLDLQDGLLPFPPQSFPGFRNLVELLSFPQKHWFVDLSGWQQLRETTASQRGTSVEAILYFQQSHESLERNLTNKHFVLDCTPIVNLFSKSAEPIDFNHRETAYWVLPSRSQPIGHEVYMIEEITCADPGQGRSGRFVPFYASDFQATEDDMGYWLAERREAAWLDDARKREPNTSTEVFLHLVDRELNLKKPTRAVANVQVLCTNRNIPWMFQIGGHNLVLQYGVAAMPITAKLLNTPTEPMRPPLRRNSYWRLLSQNALNHASLVGATSGPEALQELLRLCDFTGSNKNHKRSAVIQHAIAGIRGVKSEPALGRVTSGKNLGLCRGLKVEVELDERNYVGTGVLLFASVLERFFGLYTSTNSFAQLVVKTTQSKEILKKWPPRTAEKQLSL